jgi:hypothetical protein
MFPSFWKHLLTIERHDIKVEDGGRLVYDPLVLSEGRTMVATGERVHYLSLALDARRAVNAIRAAKKGNESSNELRDSIRAATESLEALQNRTNLYANLAPAHYVQYEEIQTLSEVSSGLETASLIQSLKSLMSGSTNAPLPADLDLARRFFRALESRALHHYSDPASSDVFAA